MIFISIQAFQCSQCFNASPVQRPAGQRHVAEGRADVKGEDGHPCEGGKEGELEPEGGRGADSVGEVTGRGKEPVEEQQ